MQPLGAKTPSIHLTITPHKNGLNNLSPSNHTTEAWVTNQWEELLSHAPIGIAERFIALGGDSKKAKVFIHRVALRYEYQLTTATVFQFPTIQQLARIIDKKQSFNDDDVLVPLQPDGNHPPFFLIHTVGGCPFWGYAEIVRHLDPDQPVYGFRHTPAQSQEQCSDIRQMAALYVRRLRAFLPTGPYLIGGYCFGGNIAYEMARLLDEQGQPAHLVALLNSSPPNGSYDHMSYTPRTALLFAGNLAGWLWTFAQSTWTFKYQYARWRILSLREKTNALLSRPSESSGEAYAHLIDFNLFPQALWPIVRNHIQSILDYDPKAYSGHVTLIRTRTHCFRCSFDRHYGWQELAHGGVDLHVIPGTHENMMDEPYVRHLALALTQALTSAVQPR